MENLSFEIGCKGSKLTRSPWAVKSIFHQSNQQVQSSQNSQNGQSIHQGLVTSNDTMIDKSNNSITQDISSKQIPSSRLTKQTKSVIEEENIKKNKMQFNHLSDSEIMEQLKRRNPIRTQKDQPLSQDNSIRVDLNEDILKENKNLNQDQKFQQNLFSSTSLNQIEVEQKRDQLSLKKDENIVECIETDMVLNYQSRQKTSSINITLAGSSSQKKSNNNNNNNSNNLNVNILHQGQDLNYMSFCASQKKEKEDKFLCYENHILKNQENNNSKQNKNNINSKLFGKDEIPSSYQSPTTSNQHNINEEFDITSQTNQDRISSPKGLIVFQDKQFLQNTDKSSYQSQQNDALNPEDLLMNTSEIQKFFVVHQHLKQKKQFSDYLSPPPPDAQTEMNSTITFANPNFPSSQKIDQLRQQTSNSNRDFINANSITSPCFQSLIPFVNGDQHSNLKQLQLVANSQEERNFSQISNKEVVINYESKENYSNIANSQLPSLHSQKPFNFIPQKELQTPQFIPDQKQQQEQQQEQQFYFGIHTQKPKESLEYQPNLKSALRINSPSTNNNTMNSSKSIYCHKNSLNNISLNNKENISKNHNKSKDNLSKGNAAQDILYSKRQQNSPPQNHVGGENKHIKKPYLSKVKSIVNMCHPPPSQKMQQFPYSKQSSINHNTSAFLKENSQKSNQMGRSRSKSIKHIEKVNYQGVEKDANLKLQVQTLKNINDSSIQFNSQLSLCGLFQFMENNGFLSDKNISQDEVGFETEQKLVFAIWTLLGGQKQITISSKHLSELLLLLTSDNIFVADDIHIAQNEAFKFSQEPVRQNTNFSPNTSTQTQKRSCSPQITSYKKKRSNSASSTRQSGKYNQESFSSIILKQQNKVQRNASYNNNHYENVSLMQAYNQFINSAPSSFILSFSSEKQLWKNQGEEDKLLLQTAFMPLVQNRRYFNYLNHQQQQQPRNTVRDQQKISQYHDKQPEDKEQADLKNQNNESNYQNRFSKSYQGGMFAKQIDKKIQRMRNFSKEKEVSRVHKLGGGCGSGESSKISSPYESINQNSFISSQNMNASSSLQQFQITPLESRQPKCVQVSLPIPPKMKESISTNNNISYSNFHLLDTSKKEQITMLEVNLGIKGIDKILIRQGDNPAKITYEFSQKHGLEREATEKLFGQLENLFKKMSL